MNPTESRTVLGRSVKMHGELSGAEELVIDGEFSGTIHLPGGRLTIGREAKVRAQVLAQDVVIYGRMEGELRVTGSVALRETAAVIGDVIASRFSMEEGTALRGRVDPSRVGEPFPVVALKPVAAPVQQVVQPPLQLMTERFPVEKPKPLELFEADAVTIERPVVSYASMPAGLAAAAARHFAGAPAPAAEPAEPATTFDSPGELAETEA